MNQPPITPVISLAREAGARIMHHRGRVAAEDKSDGSPVTVADKEASAIIVTGLKSLTPGIPVISEEADPEDNERARRSSRYWVVDPLDGTRSYLRGHDGFGVHIALIEEGEPVKGVVYFPAKGAGELYYTGDDGHAWKQEGQDQPHRISVSRDFTGRALKAAVNHKKDQRPVDIRGHFYQAVCGVGGGRVCLAADGQADVAWMVRDAVQWSYSWWDVAAAHAVLKAAGGDLLDYQTGKPFRYNGAHFGVPDVVGGHKDVLRRLDLC